MIALLALFLAAGPAQPLPEMDDTATPRAAAERVMRCGVGPVAVKSRPELDRDVLVVTASAPLSEDQIVCIDKAASFYDVELPAADQPRFDRTREARAAAYLAGEGRKWLATHGLLDRLPAYQPGATGDADFAHKIEALCHAKGALSSGYGLHTLNPDWTNVQVGKFDPNDSFACLLNAALARGYPLGFIGNEAMVPQR